jgi:hypothetical protein
LNSGPHACQTGAQPHELMPAFFVCVGYSEIGSRELFAWLPWNCDPPALCPEELGLEA